MNFSFFFFYSLAWISILNDAARGELGATTMSFEPYYDILGVDADQIENDQDSSYNDKAAAISLAYRQVALRTHPERGGDSKSFKKVQEAFDMVMSKLEEDEFERLITLVEFQADIRKVSAYLQVLYIYAFN
jgi:hypothetical protein